MVQQECCESKENRKNGELGMRINKRVLDLCNNRRIITLHSNHNNTINQIGTPIKGIFSHEIICAI